MNKYLIRLAKKSDLESIVGMLANDKLGVNRERYQIPLPTCYSVAFDTICADKNNELWVAEVDSVTHWAEMFQITHTYV